MLARTWSPLLRGAGRHPLAIAVLAVALVGALAAPPAARIAPTRAEVLATTVAAVVIALVARRAGPIAGTLVGVAVVRLSAAALDGSSPHAGAIMPIGLVVAAALLLPLLHGLAVARARDGAVAAGVRGIGYAVIALQPIVIGLALVAPSMAPAVAVGVLGAAFAASAWRRPRGPTSGWTELAAEPRGADLVDAVVGATVLGGGLVGLAIGGPVLGDGQRAVIAMTVGCATLWTIVTGRGAHLGASLAATSATLGWLALAGPWPGRDVALALGIAQAPALAMVIALQSPRGWPRWIGAAQFGLIWVGVRGTPWSTPCIVAGAAAYLMHGAVPRPRMRTRHAGPATARVRHALRCLEPSWCWYGRAKLARDPVYGALAAAPRPLGRVLDIGCGPGLAAGIVAARGDSPDYLGIDLDADKLHVARRLLATLGRPLDDAWRLAVAALPSRAIPTAAFDTVLMIDVLHYWPLDVQRALVAQARAALVDGGELWLRDAVTDDAGAARVLAGERLTTRFGLNPPNPLRFVEREQLEALLRQNGFALDASAPCGDGNRLWRCRAVADAIDATRAGAASAAG